MRNILATLMVLVGAGGIGLAASPAGAARITYEFDALPIEDEACGRAGMACTLATGLDGAMAAGMVEIDPTHHEVMGCEINGVDCAEGAIVNVIDPTYSVTAITMPSIEMSFAVGLGGRIEIRPDSALAPMVGTFHDDDLTTTSVGFTIGALDLADTAAPASTPVPAPFALLLAGLGALSFVNRRPRRAA